ncbi:hypothetical protein Agub_g10097 [Astrephomene gubernaculifera]|uniref:Uncharacterized protein n=1 Tax=Astrephomene gubernaculifera TaxID=47775 RepID=A0AAD3DUB1_9CHLO|nr:hypothetical protein Agub_g10097 [Astrephomene gubernaculifera]
MLSTRQHAARSLSTRRCLCNIGRQPRALPAICRAASNRKEHFNEMEGLAEAYSLFEQARTMSHFQTQHELEQAFMADLGTGVQAVAGEQASRLALVSFWCEQGLSQSSSEALVQRLEDSGRRYSIQQVSAKVQRLNRILPDADIAAIVERDPAVLDMDPALAIRNMVLLVEAFPGKQVADLAQRQPRLLYCPDLPERAERVLALLTRLHPSRQRRVVAPVVGENPDLLFRMDYYQHVYMIDELPIEIQNMFVLADQGVSFLYRYYKRMRNDFIVDSTSSDEEAGV